MLFPECKFDAELKKIKMLLLVNGHAKCVSTSTIECKIVQFNGVKVFGPTKCPVYIKLPWIGPVSQV